LITPTCNPISGSEFSVGSTQVTCTVTDLSGNVATGSFTVSVQNLEEVVQIELITLEKIKIESIEDVDEHLDDFVNVANILFDFQRQSLDDLKMDLQVNIQNADAATIKELRKAFNKDLKEIKEQSKDLLKQYDSAFKEFSHSGKDLVKQLKSLSVNDKKSIQKMDQSYMKIINTNSGINKEFSSVFASSGLQMISYVKEDLDKTKTKINFTEKNVDRKATKDQIEQWKQTKKDLENTIKNFKNEIKQIKKDSKKEIKSLIKEAKKEIKTLEKDAKVYEKFLKKLQKETDKQAKKDQKELDKQQKELDKQQKEADKEKKKVDKKKKDKKK